LLGFLVPVLAPAEQGHVDSALGGSQHSGEPYPGVPPGNEHNVFLAGTESTKGSYVVGRNGTG